MDYRVLKPEEIVLTTRRLRARIGERFADSGLNRVCDALLEVTEEATATTEWIEKPNLWLRAGVVLCILFVIILGIAAFSQLRIRLSFQNLSELLQGIDSGINDVVFVGIAIVFLVRWENRLKRNRALKALHALRSLAHIIDMHQLTKDPERIMNTGSSTDSSPERKMSPFELTRYLDYCSEMLSVISKVAAVYVQNFDDSETLVAVNEIENLTAGLSRKIWQKIMILDRIASET